MINTLGQTIKRFRVERNWAQNDLAKRSGLVRSHISLIERGKVLNPSAEIFLKLARAFDIRPEELYEAAGYITEAQTAYRYKETPQDAAERLKLSLPKPVPFYEDYKLQAGLRQIAYYVYPVSEVNPNMEACRIHGNSLEPQVKDMDILVIDLQAEINNGDIAVVLVGGNIAVVQVRKMAGELWLENNRGKLESEECQIVGVVTELIRKLR
ncbi:hypothetical protein ES703_46415 [subsurface metagenome]